MKIKNWIYRTIVLKCRCKKLNIVAGEGVIVGRGIRNIRHARIVLGDGSRIDRNVTFGDNGTVVIGKNTNIAEGAVIYCGHDGGVTIGDNCLIARETFIIDSDHGFGKEVIIDRQPNRYDPVVIGNDCLLCHRSVVLRGTKLGDGCVVGANSVAKGTFPPYSILAGVPAKIVKHRE